MQRPSAFLLAILAVLLCVSMAHAQTPEPDAMRVYIPRMGLFARVGECAIVDGWHDTSQLGDGVCHLEGTATLDYDWARIVLAAHDYGAFADLHELRAGDSVLLWNAHAIELYTVVESRVVDVSDTRWLAPTDDETLTLLTCEGARRRAVHAVRTH